VLVAEGTARAFDGSLDDYRDLVLGSGQGRAGNGRKSPREGGKPERLPGGEARERVKALRKVAVQAEAELKRLWQLRAETDKKLAAPSANGGASMSELMKTRAELDGQVNTAEQLWLEASEAAERATS
jgi:ATP-binding cassette subfamily F protein 3